MLLAKMSNVSGPILGRIFAGSVGAMNWELALIHRAGPPALLGDITGFHNHRCWHSSVGEILARLQEITLKLGCGDGSFLRLRRLSTSFGRGFGRVAGSNGAHVRVRLFSVYGLCFA
jgi:hypothetical protein